MSSASIAVKGEIERKEMTIRTVAAASTPSYGLSTDLSDTVMIADICQRQEQALALLYDRYGPLLYAIALRITRDHGVAEEVIQDVFHTVWHSADSFRLDGVVKAWLIGIVRHRAIDATRVRQFRAHRATLMLDECQRACVTDEPETVVMDLTEREEIQYALASLPPSQRHAIDLAYYDGLTCSQIAARTGLPLGTVKTRLRLGLMKLRALLCREPRERYVRSRPAS